MTIGYGIPVDVITDEPVGDRGLKVKQDDRLLLKGNNFDRFAVQNLDYRDDTIARGMGYYVDYTQTALAANSKTYGIVTTPSDKYLALINRELVTDKERAFYRVYPTFGSVTTGNAITIRNLRTDSTINTGTTIFECTVAVEPDPADSSFNVPIFGAGGGGPVSASGGIQAGGAFRLIQPNSQILIEWENATSETMYFHTVLEWLEIDENAILPTT